MAASRDKFGRPIVVVTGMGIVTSLGAGKQDNWTKLTAGESGIRTITRFPIDGLKTTMAGTIDFITVEPSSSTALTEKLADMAAPVAVVTFNGFGGAMPPSYTCLGDEPAANDRLELWLKLLR